MTRIVMYGGPLDGTSYQDIPGRELIRYLPQFFIVNKSHLGQGQYILTRDSAGVYYYHWREERWASARQGQ